jgi:hypothetical protein
VNPASSTPQQEAAYLASKYRSSQRLFFWLAALGFICFLPWLLAYFEYSKLGATEDRIAQLGLDVQAWKSNYRLPRNWPPPKSAILASVAILVTWAIIIGVPKVTAARETARIEAEQKQEMAIADAENQMEKDKTHARLLSQALTMYALDSDDAWPDTSSQLIPYIRDMHELDGFVYQKPQTNAENTAAGASLGYIQGKGYTIPVNSSH